ncbi:MAG: aminoglycoside 6-adenylyltransferase [Chloroflexi bacterium]|nr:aminoglycoside 6-adenylyltransferase [Chloroflexota bacterium]
MLDHAQYRQLQETILQLVVQVCAADAQVLAVTVTGSYARGQNDAFSDLDVDVYFVDEPRTGATLLHQRVSQVAPTLSVLYLYDQNGLYLFDNGVRLGLTYKRRGEVRADSAASARIVHDPHGILKRELGTEHVLAHPVHPPYFQPGEPAYVHWFLWMFRQIYGWAKRAAQGDHRSLDKLLDAGASLQLVRGSLLQMRRWTLGSMDYIGVVDPDTATELARTFSLLTPDDVLIAVRQLLDLYERICPDYRARACVDYPVSQVARLREVLDTFDALK